VLYRLSRFGLSKLFWITLLMCAFVALGNDRAEAEEVLASWYGPGFEGLPTASGETFDPYGYTAAHKTLPLGTQLTVSYNGFSVPVTVNDRGPYVGARELDLSQGAAESIGLTRTGVDYVDLIVTDYGYEESYTASEYPATDYYAPDYPVYSSGADYSATQAGGGAYLVQSGDTLSGIAAELGTTVEDLAAANGIADPDVLFAGQTLYY
jgi:rare lipoprotein A